ncbi:MAG: bifunctional riboflavin kinase/FAD synthetase [Vulcanimicrobiota bacterium]
MKIIDLVNIKHSIDTDLALALGYFDGIHLGHQKILKKTVDEARKAGIASGIFTFRQHPIEVLNPKLCFPYLTTLEEKQLLVKKTGIEYYIETDFTKVFSQLTPEHFVQRILLKKLNGKIFIAGRDYRFGHGGAGDVELFDKLLKPTSSKLVLVDKVNLDQLKISSTRIREALLMGYVDEANEMLGRWYSISGKVKPGKGVGRKLGIPTANIDIHQDKIFPRPGVYCVIVRVNQNIYCGIAHLGDKPTFKEHHYNLEVNIFDFNQDIYGKHIRVYFLNHIRDTSRYSTVDEMMGQINMDIEYCRTFLCSINEETINENIN